MGVDGLKLDPTSPSDAAALVALRRAVVREGMWFTVEPDELREDTAQRAEMIRQLRRSGNSVSFVARVGSETVGVVYVEGGPLRRIRHVGRLEILVAGAWRGRGVGDALVSAALRQAALTPALEKVELAVYAHNARAIALYARHGFVEEGRRMGQQNLPDGSYADEVWMARWLRGGPRS